VAKKRAATAQHRWGGAGYVCADCGGIKDGTAAKSCPGGGKTGFDVWLYHVGAGWWLCESEVSDKSKALRLLTGRVGIGNVVAAAVLPAGHPLGLFTRQMR
jgi:hypothetical protein